MTFSHSTPNYDGVVDYFNELGYDVMEMMMPLLGCNTAPQVCRKTLTASRLRISAPFLDFFSFFFFFFFFFFFLFFFFLRSMGAPPATSGSSSLKPRAIILCGTHRHRHLLWVDSISCSHNHRYFIEPVVLTVNYAAKLGYKHIVMLGLSGGGWTTTVSAAGLLCLLVA